MNLFSETFLTLLIYGSLVWTGSGVLLLLALLFKDFKNKQVW